MNGIFGNMVSDIANFNFFIHLSSLFVSNLIRISSLSGSCCHFSRMKRHLVKRSDNRACHLNSHIRIHIRTIGVSRHGVSFDLVSDRHTPHGINGATHRGTGGNSTNGGNNGHHRINGGMGFRPSDTFHNRGGAGPGTTGGSTEGTGGPSTGARGVTTTAGTGHTTGGGITR